MNKRFLPIILVQPLMCTVYDVPCNMRRGKSVLCDNSRNGSTHARCIVRVTLETHRCLHVGAVITRQTSGRNLMIGAVPPLFPKLPVAVAYLRHQQHRQTAGRVFRDVVRQA